VDDSLLMGVLHCLEDLNEQRQPLTDQKALWSQYSLMGIMHQRGRLQCLAWLLAGQFHSSQLPQFTIDQRKKLLGCLGITLLNLRQDAGNVGHGAGGREMANEGQTSLSYAPEVRMSSFEGSHESKVVVAENVGLMRCLSSDFSSHHPTELNSRLTIEFSARKTCFGKRLGISDAPTAFDQRLVWLDKAAIPVGARALRRRTIKLSRAETRAAR